MSEVITLIGGPADQSQWLWEPELGDRLEFLEPRGDLSVPAQAEGFRDLARPTRAIYLRSIVTRSIFVWQP